MSAHVLLNLLNELRKSDIYILSLFRNGFNKFNNTRTRCPSLHRGSYMSAHVLLNLLNELRKRDIYILSLFSNKLNKFNNTRA